jgi:hypothetical protein
MVEIAFVIWGAGVAMLVWILWRLRTALKQEATSEQA